jgi:hypothetical protein
MRYVILRNCRQDLPAAYTTTRAMYRMVTTALRTTAVAAAAAMTPLHCPAVRKIRLSISQAVQLGRAKSI